MDQFNSIKLRAFLTLAWFWLPWLFSGVLIADNVNPQSAPKCAIEPGDSTAHIGNAGCIIQQNRKILMPRHKPTGTWNLPGGTSEPGESAQCTAHRETWEETGIEVVVGPLVRKFENGFYLYRCSLKTPVTDIEKPVVLPELSKNEVTEIRWMDPKTIKIKDYRFPKQLDFIQALAGQ